MKTKHKLIKLSDTHYVAVDDSEIKEGDWVIDKHKNIYQQVTDKIFEQFTGVRKITHSTEPLSDECKYCTGACEQCVDNIKPLSLSEVEEVINGYSVEEMADEWSADINNVHPADSYIAKEGYLTGFKAHQKIVKDKLFTIDDMWQAFDSGIMFGKEGGETELECFNRELKDILPKTEWSCIFDEQGKIKLI